MLKFTSVALFDSIRVNSIRVNLLRALLLSFALTQAASANLLYSWTHKDGTPTFSPDPPPKGVPYVVVGPDLQPLPDQSTPAGSAPQQQSFAQQTAPVLPAAPVKRAGDIVMTPAPGSLDTAAPSAPVQKPVADWKPVKYADDPNPGANQPVFTSRAATVESVTPAANEVSAMCLDLKHQLNLLEGQFANAYTSEEMDTAVVNLNIFKKQNKGACGI